MLPNERSSTAGPGRTTVKAGAMEASALDLLPDRLETVLEDGEFVLYRGAAAHTTPARSVLIVMPRSEHPRPQAVRMLEHEHALRDRLDPAWALRALALTTIEGRPALVLEDPGGELLLQRVGTPMDVADVLRVGVGMAAAVRQMHDDGLVHKDIKPSNVMTDWGTDRVWLRGFGIASRLPRERRPPEPPEVIAGTLAYMAPEQTGWMNRSIDARSDLYALGVALYECSTGTLPFTASDPMALVHGHIAKRPVPPAARRQDLPEAISAIVMKLLAKAAEDRYQTAAGVEHDLRHCLAQWEANGRIDAFPLAEHDTPDRLVIPENLYGRACDIATLLGAFERVVTSGTPELVLVSGYSGIGKSSVVNELHKVLVPPRGLFASGKFDQHKRDIPYATLAQAFQNLVRYLLGKSDAELSAWRDALVEALGPNGSLMIDLVPELELIIGNQPPVPELPAQDARRRFHVVLRRFIGLFAQQNHPLALFLDDLQWLDAATLDLLEDLLTPPGVAHLLLIGAYRDHEVTPAHPLTRTLEAIRHAGGSVREIALAPLASEHVRQLVADALRCDPAHAAPLAQLVHGKTGGNPFFIVQFLPALAEEGWLAFNRQHAQWSWDLNRIHARGYRDNVVDLMVGRLNRLPLDTQLALQQLACLGNIARVGMLAAIRAKSAEQVDADLWDAVRLELVEHLGDSYQFVHDRVEEAAYSLIPEEQRDEVHLQIGRRLAAHIPPEQREEAIFDIVNQLNRGASLITSTEEREQVAELNLIAGRRAKHATAYASALTYLTAGRALLTKDCWERCAALTFALEIHRAECEFFTGAFAVAEERLSMLSGRAERLVDLASVTQVREELYTTLGRSDRAVEACLEYLRHIGVSWSAHPAKEDVQREYERVWRQIGSRAIEDLVDLPLMTDPEGRATMEVLTAVLAPAALTHPDLLLLVVCRMANLSLEHGNSDGSCFAYVWLGTAVGSHFGNYRAGFSFGKLGLDLVERRGLQRFEARVYHLFSIISSWMLPVRTGLGLMRRALDAANRLGDIAFAGFSQVGLIPCLLAAGEPLADVQREAEAGLDFARRYRFEVIVDLISLPLRLIRTLRGLTPELGSFDDTEFDEGRFEQQLAEDPRFSRVAHLYWLRKLEARFFAGAYGSAVEAATNAHRLSPPMSAAVLQKADYEFYAALARAALCHAGAGAEHTRHMEALAAHHRQLQEWAENCPENFEDRAALVGAEIARLEGREVEAERLYEQAIRSARDHGFVHNEALAYELAARFYAARGLEPFADLYLRKARHGYVRWGADGKVRQLDRLYPHVREDEPASHSRDTIAAPVEQLELATVLKVSQAISREIVLETLVETVLRTAIEYGGAERGLLLLPRGSELWIRGEAQTDGGSAVVRLCETLVSGTELSESVVRYAVRTQDSVIIDDARAQSPFSADEYIRERRPRSILCLPLVKQGALVALLYLENNLAANVFTSARLSVLGLLASQAAISLENGRLYRELGERERQFLRVVDANTIAIFTWDIEGRILDANDAFLQIIGYEREDLRQGRLRWTDLTPPEILKRELEQLAPQYKLTGRLAPLEKEYFHKDGHRVPVLIGVAPFDDEFSRGMAFIADLTESKRAEEARQRAEGELQQARNALARRQRVSMLGELAAWLAHEIKQPIAAARIDAKVCLRALADDRLDVQAAREAASRLITDATRADEIVKRTTALYKRETTHRGRVDVNAVIRELVLLFQREAGASSIAVRTNLAEGIPDVIADRIQLQQVFMNLMLNAIEAMKDTGGELTITSQQGEGAELLMSVRDTGVGLPSENPDQIFDSFVTTKPQGTGMGLSITRSIVESHGGRLWATTNAGPGATFLFTLLIEAGEQHASQEL
jgi:PAS domain S-box-containing protein